MIEKYKKLSKALRYVGITLTIIFLGMMLLLPNKVDYYFYTSPLGYITYIGLAVSLVVILFGIRIRYKSYEYKDYKIDIISGMFHNYLFVNGEQKGKVLTILKEICNNIVIDQNGYKIEARFTPQLNTHYISCYINGEQLKKI